MKKYKELDILLNDCKKKNNEKPTHARIPCHSMNISGGSYHIPQDLLPLFYKLYTKKLFKKKIKEYLVETQDRENGGPILIDLDMKFGANVKSKQWTEIHDSDMIELILEKLCEMCNFKNDSNLLNLDIYIFKKDKIDIYDGYSKEGIHILIGGIMDHIGQMHLRDLMLQDFDDQILDGLEVTNSKTEIYDNHITNGGGQWQMYGSRKAPNKQAYKLKEYYKCHYIENDNKFNLHKMETKDHPILKDRTELFSTRNKKWSTFSYKEEILKYIQNKKTQKTTSINMQHISTINAKIININQYLQQNLVNTIKNENELEDTIQSMINSTDHMDQIVNQSHEYTMVLSSEYYSEFEKWIRVGWALKNTHPILILTWLKFSLKYEGCSWSDVPKRISEWNGFSNSGGLTLGSIKRWAKLSNEQEYNKIYQSSLDYYLNRCLKSRSYDESKHVITEWDVAMVAKTIFGDKFACIDTDKKIWYYYDGNKWTLDSGRNLRIMLSNDLSRIFSGEERKVTAKIKKAKDEAGQAILNELMAKGAIFNKIAIALRKATEKHHIMKECRDIFYNGDLLNKLDTNAYTIGFNNGVYDFEEKKFRKGRPDDYISLSTKIDYIKIDYSNEEHVKMIDLINEFMEKIFPNEDLRNYMWDHLASGLIGHNHSQTFNIYTGSGRNGKSKVVEFMELILGDYKKTCPITLITSKRSAIGSSSSEIAKLKGARYVVMQEPSKGDVINEGIMKEITGDDVIEARALYSNSIEFRPMFTFCCCTNNLFAIKSNDDGTWRRIRKCDFASKFIKPSDKEWPPSHVPDDNEFECDMELSDKLKQWAPIFASMLVNRAQNTMGKVKDCDIVKSASNTYRESQDYLSKFFNEKIKEGEKTDKISKSNIIVEYKEWWKIEKPSEKMPPMSELEEFLTEKCGTYKRRGWWGYKIIYDEYDDEEDFD
jgi:P4 family phage/plasmid primase-like protien